MSRKPRDKRMTIDEVVAELEDGMTIGIGGWGPRRKPMALVRAILRSDLKDLTLVSWGGADVGLLTRAGKVSKLVYAFVSLDSVPLEPNFQRARQQGTVPEVVELDEGMFQTGLRAAAQRLPFLPMRAGLGSDVLVNNPWIKTVAGAPTPTRTLVAVPALDLDVALVHLNRADVHGNATYLGPDPYFDDLFCMAAEKAYVSCRADRGHCRADRRHPGPAAAAQPDDGRPASSRPRTARTSRPARPTTSATSGSSARTPPRPAARTRSGRPSSSGSCPATRRPTRPPSGPSRRSSHDATRTRADVCAAAIADAFKDDGEIFASPMGMLPMLGVRLAKLTSNPDLVISDGESLFLAGVPPLFAKGDVVEGWIPFRKVFDVVAYGKRHVMMGATQVDRHGNQNISAIGDFARPKRQLLGSPRRPGQHRQQPDVVLGAQALTQGLRRGRRHRLRCGSCPGQGGRACRSALQRHPPDRVQPRRLRRQGTRRHGPAALGAPGVTVDEVVEATGFELDVPADVPTSREPTMEELIVIREVLDPKGMRFKEVPDGD